MASPGSTRRPQPGLDKMNNTAFFYGTLMAPNVLLDIFEGSQYERQRVKVRLLRGIEDNEARRPQRPEFETSLEQEENLEQEVGVEEVEAHTYIWIDDPSALEPKEWDFEEFKRDKMQAWMGLSTDDTNGVKMDEGFNDVDRAQLGAGGSVDPDSGPKDGMGGRGVNGHIGRELAEAQRNSRQDFAGGAE
ncbi:hypothetical protein DV737_g1255, partial [Chaetothyriales sp. CBS 132003]